MNAPKAPMHWEVAHFDQLSPHGLYRIFSLRQQVFVVEQNCVYQDLDGLDTQSIHICCWKEKELLAYERCLPPGVSYSQSSIGRIIVVPEARGLIIGRELVQRGIDYNEQHWPESEIKIGAQAHLQSFYGSLGFQTQGEAYVEDGIPHVHMIRQAAKPRA